MEEQLITLETAKLAKEKGFMEMTLTYAILGEGNVKFPTQSLLQKWLREVYWIEVYPFAEGRRKNKTLEYQCEVTDDRINSSTTIDGRFKTYEQALEKGLQEALKLIKS